MSEQNEILGKTTIAPEVLVKIASLTTSGVQGVKRLASIPVSVDRLFSRSTNEGIKIAVENDLVFIDVYVILENDVNVRDVSRTIQQKISRAISEMVGMEIGRINIHVEDIEYSPIEPSTTL